MADNIAEDLLKAEALNKAVRLRVRGAHWNEIAERCGYPSPAAALRAVGEAMEAATQRATETVDQLRDTANLQLDALLHEAWDVIDDSETATDPEGNPVGPDGRVVKLRALDEARRIIADKAKLNKLHDKTKEENTEAPGIRIIGVAVEDVI